MPVGAVGNPIATNRVSVAPNPLNTKPLASCPAVLSVNVLGSGVVIDCPNPKKEPLNVIYGLKISDTEYDNEGRVITCEYKNFYLIHVYTPNSGDGLKRLDFRVNIWDKMFIKYIKKLQENKPVIICGDLNVAHKEIDIKNSKTNLHTSGFTIEERNSFNNILTDLHLIDTFRYLNPEEIKYSFWSYKFKSRDKNIGWRLDYFLVSENLFKKVINSDIMIDMYGSDHAPIILKIKV